MKQKKIVSMIGALVLIISAMVIIGCQQANGNTNNTGSDWSPVSNKSDLVGTWKFSYSSSGVVEKRTFYVKSDFSGYFKIDVNYSMADASFADNVDEVVSNLEGIGFTVDHDKTNKTISAKQDFTSTDLQDMVSSIELNSSKTKIKFTLSENSIEYTKQ